MRPLDPFGPGAPAAEHGGDVRRPHVQDARVRDARGQADEHGGDLAAHPGARLDFSVNLNPLGVPPAVTQAMRAAVDEVAAYPDPWCRALRDALARHHGVPADRVVCGNGASDLIHRVCAALRPRHVVTCAPTFSEYERSARLSGATVTRHVLDPGRDFDVDDAFLDALTDDVDLLFCCQPNNPTGRLIDPQVLDRVVRRAADSGAVLVVDECFLPFTGGASLIGATGRRPNLVVLRAFTKTFALAGARLGYAVTGSPRLASALAEHGPRWNVSSIAQAAGLAALAVPGWDDGTRRTGADSLLGHRVGAGWNDTRLMVADSRPGRRVGAGWGDDTRRVVAEERTWVTARLRDLGLEVVPSHANFVLFRSPVDLARPLLERGLMIRSCGNFAGLDSTYWRVGLKRRPDNVVLIDALQAVVHG